MDFNKELDSIKIGEQNKEETFDYEKMYNDCFVDLDIVIDRPPAAISIGKYKYNIDGLKKFATNSTNFH